MQLETRVARPVIPQGFFQSHTGLLIPRYSYVMSDFGSPSEYDKIDRPQIVAKGKTRGLRAEHPSVEAYPVRGGAATIAFEYPVAIVQERKAVLDFFKGFRQICTYYGKYKPIELITIPDPLRGSLDDVVDVFDASALSAVKDVAAQFRRTELGKRGVNQVSFMTHATTPESHEFAEAFAREAGVTVEFTYGDKPYKQPNTFDRSGFSSSYVHGERGQSFAERHNLPAPFGLVGYTLQEIEEAFIEVSNGGRNPVFGKVAGSGGSYGVMQLNSVTDLHNTYRTWESYHMLDAIYANDPHHTNGRSLAVEIQAAIPGLKERNILSFQYYFDHVYTPARRGMTAQDPRYTRQYLEGTEWKGNEVGTSIVGDGITYEQQEKIEHVIAESQRQHLQAFREEGVDVNLIGGIDFGIVSVEEVQEAGLDPKEFFRGVWDVIQEYDAEYGPVDIENNGARVPDPTTAYMVAEALGIEPPYAALKAGKVQCSLEEAWEFLVKNNLNYNKEKGQDGIIPWAWIYDPEYDIFYGNVLVKAHNPDELVRVKERVFSEMEKAGIIQVELHTQ